MIFQDPMTSLNPVERIGDQIVEQIQEHEALPDQQARERAVELLDRVGIPRARERIDNYPYEFSGGMRQRVMIALALSCNPDVLIADEPTTALDVTIQAQILERMRELRDETGAGDHPRHARPRRRGRHRRPDRRHVRRADRGAGDARRDLLRPAAPVHLGPARLDRARRPAAARAAAGDRRACRRRSPTGPQGCHFRPRCPHEFGKCTEVPPLEARLDGQAEHRDRCWLTPEEKRERREVRPGEIGLDAKAGAA